MITLQCNGLPAGGWLPDPEEGGSPYWGVLPTGSSRSSLSGPPYWGVLPIGGGQMITIGII